MSQRPDTKVDRDIGTLRETVLRMARLSEAILGKSLQAIWERNPALSLEVKADDIAIDRLDVEIDDTVLRILALDAPVASDLRLVVAVKSIATDLERVGDIARNIAGCARRLSEVPEIGRFRGLRRGAGRSLRCCGRCRRPVRGPWRWT